MNLRSMFHRTATASEDQPAKEDDVAAARRRDFEERLDRELFLDIEDSSIEERMNAAKVGAVRSLKWAAKIAGEE